MDQLIAIKISDKDNVATVFTKGANAGASITITASNGKIGEITLKQDIPYGHKVALEDIAEGVEITKFGESIGKTSKPIKIGEHVHVHNLDSMRARGDLQ